MNANLPDYRSKEDGVLYIIGNGFDLYHGLNTRYSDFYDWLKERHLNFIDQMQKIYPETDPQTNQASKDGGYMLWRDFEKALCHNNDLLDLHHFFCDNIHDFNSLPIEKQQAIASEQIKETLEQISPLFKEWVESFSEKYKELHKLLPLGEKSKYITFNYTRVLEEVYSIEGEEHVWHIHGSVCDEKIITGYGGTLWSETVLGSDVEETSERKILQELQTMRKPTESIFNYRPKSFKSQQGINSIIVIGHSLADVDVPYLRYMLEPLSDYADIEWQYWVHDEEAMQEARKRVKSICNDNPLLENKMAESRWKYYIMDNWKQREMRYKEIKENKIII